MKKPAEHSDYHLVRFERSVEAAAFIAAFSRYLDSPRGADFAELEHGIEVWERPEEKGDVVDVYLNDVALEAASVAFAPVKVDRTLGRRALPADSSLILGKRRAHGWGLEEAHTKLKHR